jgi:hypothetical protein
MENPRVQKSTTPNRITQYQEISFRFCFEVKKVTFSSNKVEEFKGDEIDPCFEFRLSPPPRGGGGFVGQEVTRHRQVMILIETHFSSPFSLECENITPSSSLPDFCHTCVIQVGLCTKGVGVWAWA